MYVTRPHVTVRKCLVPALIGFNKLLLCRSCVHYMIHRVLGKIRAWKPQSQLTVYMYMEDSVHTCVYCPYSLVWFNITCKPCYTNECSRFGFQGNAQQLHSSGLLRIVLCHAYLSQEVYPPHVTCLRVSLHVVWRHCHVPCLVKQGRVD